MSVNSHWYPILPDPNVILLQCPSIVIGIQFFPHFFLFSYISIAERNLVVNMHEMFSFLMEGIVQSINRFEKAIYRCTNTYNIGIRQGLNHIEADLFSFNKQTGRYDTSAILLNVVFSSHNATHIYYHSFLRLQMYIIK